MTVEKKNQPILSSTIITVHADTNKKNHLKKV